MDIDLVCQFWESHFEISVDHLAIQSCVKESTVLALFKDEYPQLYDSGERFRNTFIQISLNTGRELRHFKSLGNVYYFNAQRLSSARETETQTALALLNTHGLITDTTNKSQFLHDFLFSTNKGNIFAVTETHLMPDHKNAERTKSFTNYTIYRTDRNTKWLLRDSHL